MNRRAFIRSSAGIFIPAIVGTGSVLPSHRRIAAPVQESGGVDPDLPANMTGQTLYAWWKADSLSLNDGDPVSSWTDSSGNGHTAAQATGINQPLYKTSIFGSMPSVRFDGSNDFLDFDAGFGFSRLNTERWTAIYVGKYNAASRLLYYNANTVRMERTATAAFINGYSGSGSSDAFTSALSDVQCISYLKRGTASGDPDNRVDFYENLTARNVFGGTGAYDSDRISHPATVSLNGDMAEIILYYSLFTFADLTNLYDNYLKPRWGLP